MNLIIEIDESTLMPIVEATIKSLLFRSDYNSGAAAKLIEKKASDGLMNLLKGVDISPLIQEVAWKYYEGIVEDVVRKEIERHAKKVVKSMSDKGELLK